MTFVVDRSLNNPTDNRYTSASRTAANLAAVLALTPAFSGEIVRDLATGKQYRSTSLAVGAWSEIIDSGSP